MLITNVNTISGALNIVEGSGRVCIILPNNTKLYIDDALYSSKSRRNLFSFKDIRCNGYHIETMQGNNAEYFCITSFVSALKQIKEKFYVLPSSMYYTFIKMVESNIITNQKFVDPKNFILWHDRLGHPGAIMMRRIINNSHRNPLKNQKILLPNDYPCVVCSQDKLVIRPSTINVNIESPTFLEMIREDIYGPIHLPC